MIKSVEPRARLVLVGDGPLLSYYQRQRPDAIFTGFYTGINLARLYASGDIYLHANITETFGNVITEALGSGPRGTTRLTRISTDTRHISEGDCFLALKGETFDAHNFLADAVAKGATALVVSDASRAR